MTGRAHCQRQVAFFQVEIDNPQIKILAMKIL